MKGDFSRGYGGKFMLGLGLCLVVLDLVFLFAIFPMLTKMPSDYNETYNFEGQVQALNPATMSLDTIPTTATRVLNAQGLTGDDILLMKQDVSFFVAVAGTPLASLGININTSEVYAIDRTTRENVSGYGDADRSGQFTFPADVQQETYSFWSSSAKSALPANFVSEETFQGLKVYNFKIEAKDLPAGTMAGTGLPQTMDVLTEIKVEPLSGIPVYTSSTTTLKTTALPVPLFVNQMSFTAETTDEMVALGKSSRNLITWASVYGFWAVLTIGALLIIAYVYNHRLRRGRKSRS